MATLDINAIRDYLIEVGYKIEYPILVHAFKRYLYNPDPAIQATMRTRFKDFVNRLATVSVDNNMKFIVLRPEFIPTANGNQHANQNYQQQQQPPRLQKMAPQEAPPIPPPQPPPIKQQQYHPKQVQPTPSNHHDQQQQQRMQHQNQQLPQHIQQQQLPLRPSKQTKQQVHEDEQQQLKPQQQQQLPLLLPPLPPAHQYDPDQQMTPKQIPLQQLQQQPTLPVQNGHQHHQQQRFSIQRPQSLQVNPSPATTPMMMIAPPNPPPRRRQSTASLFKQPSSQKTSIVNTPTNELYKSNEIQDLPKKSNGMVKEHALRLNSSVSSADLRTLMPIRSNTMKENRLSRDSTIGTLSSALQRNGLQMTSRSRSSHREDESDSSSLQPIDPLRRRWVIEACNCNYNGLLTYLREDPKLASYKDIVNGYTALHWAAKFGNLDIIKLIAGTHGVSANIKSSAGYTPLHIAAMFNRVGAAELLIKSYKANPDIRDHSGKRANQYWPVLKEPIKKKLPSLPFK